MKGAFVIRLGSQTRSAEQHLEGWVEEVDSGKELRFHSTAELIKFLWECFQAVFPNAGNGVHPGSHTIPGGLDD
jgi:hypothetical protein